MFLDMNGAKFQQRSALLHAELQHGLTQRMHRNQLNDEAMQVFQK